MKARCVGEYASRELVVGGLEAMFSDATPRGGMKKEVLPGCCDSDLGEGRISSRETHEG